MVKAKKRDKGRRGIVKKGRQRWSSKRAVEKKRQDFFFRMKESQTREDVVGISNYKTSLSWAPQDLKRSDGFS